MKRRQFLQGVTLGAASLYANDMLAMPYKKDPLGLQLYTVRGPLAKDLEGTLNRVAELGFKNLEIFDYNGTFFGKTAMEFKSILDKAGLKVISSHHTTGRVKKGQGTMTDGWDKAVEDQHAIGTQYMVCAYLQPTERTPDQYKALPAMLEGAAKTAKTAGIQFAYHNHDFEFQPMEDKTAYDFLLNNTSKDLVKMELDLYWITKAGHDPLQYFDKYPGRFPLWHVKDMEAGSGTFAEVGQGTIDFDRIFAARKKAGLRYWFVEQDSSKRDIFESLTMSRDYLAKKKY